MKNIHIKNGYVYDPANNIHGEKKDIYIVDGKIAEKTDERKTKTIDATGKTVMPAGVDIHSHFAGAKVNMGRLFRPEDSQRYLYGACDRLRSGSGFSVPSTYLTGYTYAKMGYLTLNEPAIAPLKSRHTHEEFNDTPIVDKTGLLLMGNNQQLIQYIADGEKDKYAPWIAWMLSKTKTYGLKAVNPGGTLAWGWRKNLESIHDQVPYFNVSSAEIIKTLVNANKELNLPHPLHIHVNNIGVPGGYETAMETMDMGLEMHITHLQFSCYGGEDWRSLESEADKLADKVNKKKEISVDLGQIVFGDTTTMTADGPFEYSLGELTHLKWNNADVEDETGGGVVPYIYKKKSGVNAVQWTCGLELALKIKDPWRVYISTDHPNAGPFRGYPKIIAWLMSRKYREETLKSCNRWATERSTLSSTDRELSLQEIAIMTRAGPAKRLGIDASLTEGEKADLAIYNIGPEERDGCRIEKAFTETEYTIKKGQIVAKQGKIFSAEGSTIYTSPELDKDLKKDIEKRFLYYTILPENYEVCREYLKNPVNALKKPTTHPERCDT